ncbi:hypothetical protein ACIQ9P_21360 [Kitasatospora sp. NPDC094019]|uniref:hypothetical protein n=1 Tax=Kitasatospora sp. NPDC094019 TaxID=3364091 RepID=UPI003801926D
MTGSDIPSDSPSDTPADSWSDTWDTTAPGQGDADGVELFPVNFTAYRHHPDLDTEEHVTAIAELLAPFGPRLRRWTVSGHERNRQAVEDRLATWKRPAASHGNSLLYWVGHGSSDHLAHHRTPAPIDDGVLPQEIAHAIGGRQLHPDSADNWVIVVLDACFSQEFARNVHLALLDRHRAAGRYLLLSTAARGYAELGAFTHALKRALTVTFRGRTAIGLAEFGQELARDLGGYSGTSADDHRDRLLRLDDDIASAVSAPLDQLDEVQAVIDQLPTDERRHFVPKASGAEFGELAWYFHGRTLQRNQILQWLTTAHRGALVVTGPAGAGKSALLGHLLLHTNTRLRDTLLRHGHLTPLPAGTPCPDDPFDLTAHLAGLTLNRTVQLIADAAGLPDLAHDAAQGQPVGALASRLVAELRVRPTRLTLLFDALDEADQPLLIVDTLLRPLAALPGVRLVVGTRRSTREGPDRPAPADTDLLDALWPRPTGADPVPGPVLVEVGQDQEALAGYLRAKLTAAKHRGALDADDTDIATAVHRLVTDHPRGGGEPQQFLYARLAAHELLHDPRLITDPAPLIGRTHRQLFTRALERLHRADPHYGPLLQALGLAQGRGLPDQDGIWATTADALAFVPVKTRDSTQALLRDAAPYLALDQEHGQSVYRLAHRTFTEHFTTTPDAGHAHADITTALIHHATSVLQQPSAHDSTGTRAAPAAAVSPYICHHLAAHARLGRTAGALHTLGENLAVLDALDLTSITTAVFGHGLPARDLPPAVAGTALLQHHVRDTTRDRPTGTALAWRRWWRRLGTTYIQGTPPPAEPPHHGPGTGLPDLLTGLVRRHQLHLQLVGHTDSVQAMAVFAAPDGTPRLATGDSDGAVRVWDPVTGTQVGEALTGHTDSVQAMAVFAAPDGTPRFATGSYDGTVRVWDPVTGTQVGESLTTHTGWVLAMAVFAAPDGTPRLATGDSDGAVRVWDPVTGTQVGQPLTGHTGWVSAVAAFTAPDGTPRLATGDSDGTVRVWDPVTGAQVGEPLTTHTDWVSAVVVFAARDGALRLATGSHDGAVRIWDPVTGTQVGEPPTAHTGAVMATLVFTASSGTRRLISASMDRTVRVWKLASGAQVGEPLTGHTGGVRALAVFAAQDGAPRLATGGNDGTVRIWDSVSDTQMGEPPTAHTHGVSALAVLAAPDGTPRLATGGNDGTVRIWNPATGAQVGEPVTTHIPGVRSVTVPAAPVGTPRPATDGSDGTAWILDPPPIRLGEPPTAHPHEVLALAVFAAPDGFPRFATVTCGDDRTVRIWAPATGSQVGEPLTGHTRRVNAVEVFAEPDGTPRLATGSNDGTVRIWDPVTGTQVGEPLTIHPGEVRALAVFTAPDGSLRLATGDSDGTVRIWNPVSGAQVGASPDGHAGWVRSVAVFTASDGGLRLASGGRDGTVRIWDPVTGAQVGASLTGHADEVRALAVFTAPDGSPRLASGGRDGTVRIWNPTTRTGIAVPVATPVNSLAASHGLIIAGTEEGFLYLDLSSMYNDPTDTEPEETRSTGARP